MLLRRYCAANLQYRCREHPLCLYLDTIERPWYGPSHESIAHVSFQRATSELDRVIRLEGHPLIRESHKTRAMLRALYPVYFFKIGCFYKLLMAILLFGARIYVRARIYDLSMW